MSNNRRSLTFLILACVWAGLVIMFAVHLHRPSLLPVQPVQFSHTLHVNNLNLRCLYCHQYAEKSIRATLPEIHICKDCHDNAEIDNPEVKRMLAMIAEKGKIDWQRVYRVKEHVYFSHRVHTVLAKMNCQECHGPVENMTVAVMASGGSSYRGIVEMGWCVTCHKRRGAPRECSTCHK